jgi:hypothetical protein
MIVEAQYNWKGVLTIYRRGDSFIPLDPRNRDYQEIQQAIADGECTINEPTLGNITRAFDRHGDFSGYHTRFGFVPNYLSNHLLELINAQIADGRCTVVDPSPVEPLPKLDKLVFPMILEQPWPHIRADFHGELSYASSIQSERRSFRFTLKNLPSESSDKLDLLLKHHNIVNSSSWSLSPLQFGVIEIEVPIKELRRLFKGERPIVQAWLSPLLEDMIEQHYAQTCRKTSEGPDVAWLISHVNSYMGHFVVEFSNQILDAFWMEYGDSPVPYISEGSIGSNCVVLGYTTSGMARLNTLMWNNKQNHGLEGQWSPQALQRFEQHSRSDGFYQRTALRRVTEMVRLGFHAEALALLNAFLEVAIRSTLVRCVSESVTHAKCVANIGHTHRLGIIDAIFESHLSQQRNLYIFNDDFRNKLNGARAIYKSRNYFVHSLELPNSTGRLTLKDRRELESLFHNFVDYHEQNQFLMRLDCIANDKDLIRRVAMNEIEKHISTPTKLVFWVVSCRSLIVAMLNACRHSKLFKTIFGCGKLQAVTNRVFNIRNQNH